MKQLQNEFNYKKVGPTSLFCTKRPLAGNLYCSPSPPLCVTVIWSRIFGIFRLLGPSICTSRVGSRNSGGIEPDLWLCPTGVPHASLAARETAHLLQAFVCSHRLLRGWRWGWMGCVWKRFFLLWHKDILATLWGDILLHLHTNMMSRYHIFSWRYHDHDHDEK